MKKFIVILLISVMLIPAQTVFAANGVKDGGTDIKTCFLTYTTAMPAFLQTIVSAEGFVENFMAYFFDLISRSACQLGEIMSLDTKLDAITKQIQQAYLKCDRAKVFALQKKYVQAKAEIFYVRHIVNLTGDLDSIIGGLDMTVEEIEADADIKAAVDDEMFVDLRDAMTAMYAPLIPEEGWFDKFFSEMEIKFQTRKYEYLLCGESEIWKSVGTKWQEFITNWGGTKDAVIDTGKRVTTEASNINKSAKEMKLRYTNNASNKPAGAFKNFLQNTFQTSINKVNPVTGLTEIYEKTETYFPGNRTPDLSALYTLISNDEDRYSFDISRATLEAKYKALYAGIADAAVKSFTDNLNVLIVTIKSTAIPINQLDKCASKVLGKQCK